jgi:16S rRNA (adenine1518-N6/adenine1519-N6)-dimethyltransferase
VPDFPDVTSPRVLRTIFENLGISPRRQWGQNFLIDANVARKIVAALDQIPSRDVIEIGPGAGALTALMVQKGDRVLALEIDRGLTGFLRQTFSEFEKVQIREADALKIKWQELLNEDFAGLRPKLISNLPYVISGPFLFSILKEFFPFRGSVLMLQKEVALRLVASPGDPDYGALSVLCRYYTQGKVLFDVSSNVFWPKPKVGSSVILLLPRKRLLAPETEPLFWTVVQGLFQQRRKTILKSLGRLLPTSREERGDLLSAAGLEAGARPEELKVEQFAKLTAIIYNKQQ